MTLYIIMTVITLICSSAYVTRDGDYDPDDIMMCIGAALFWPLTIPIFTGIILGGYLKDKRFK